ncbi:hypothetical protein VitviT2T_021972 [Vitis vinifera]|uniref:Uncharacterized protein n=1 Tax=Vitis vinifera TaxID=29760 RepID=A0ABY9D8R3_VITVI|nr:hypothetical protein VitviT2T_021972 [Vitis vinifera]
MVKLKVYDRGLLEYFTWVPSLSCVQQLRYPWGLTVKFMIFRICHDKASIFKVKAMEAVDTAIGQLSHLQCVG